MALALAAAGCGSSAAPTSFDLTAVSGVRAGWSGQIVIAEPMALSNYDSDRILVRSAGTISYLGGGQWADRLPKLVQARLIQSFENGSRRDGVGRPGSGLAADRQVISDIRAFEIDADQRQAVVEIEVKVINERTGRILSSQPFSAREPVAAIDAAHAAAALDAALQQVMAQIVRSIR